MYKTIITLLTSLSVKALAAPLPTAIQEQNFVANYYPGDHGKTPVLVLEGSGSGIPKVLAEKISQLGHPVLALAYYKEANLPKHIEAIPLEYFEPAKTWLLEKSHSKELAIVGWSKGAEAALLLSTLDERIRKVVAIAPSHVVWPGIVPGKSYPNSSWTMGNQALPYVPYKADGNIRSLVDLYTNSLTEATAVRKAEIDLEHSQADLLLFSGGKDSVWPSKMMADIICKKARQNKTDTSCVHHHYPNAGHLLDASIPLDGDPQANQEADQESRVLIEKFLR